MNRLLICLAAFALVALLNPDFALTALLQYSPYRRDRQIATPCAAGDVISNGIGFILVYGTMSCLAGDVVTRAGSVTLSRLTLNSRSAWSARNSSMRDPALVFPNDRRYDGATERAVEL